MYEAQNFDTLIGTQGLSDEILNNHFTLYQGYVKNTNTLSETLTSLATNGKQSSPEYAEIKRRFGWEFNGMRLHEFYFWNMSKTPQSFDTTTPLATHINEQFGSFDAWMKDFRASGVMRGIGWVILYRDLLAPSRLFNVWVNEHDMGHLTGCQPLLVLDVFEHAYMHDYGLKRVEYIEAFFHAINWEIINQRFSATLL